MPAPLNETLLVLKGPYGPDKYQPLVPQSMTPLGYWPLSARLGFVRSSKVIVRGLAPGVGVRVGVCFGAAALASNRLSKLVFQPLLLPTVMELQAPLQPV